MEREAQDYLQYYVRDQGDYEAVDNLLEIFGMQSQTLDPAALDRFTDRRIRDTLWEHCLLGGAAEAASDMDRAHIDAPPLTWQDVFEVDYRILSCVILRADVTPVCHRHELRQMPDIGRGNDALFYCPLIRQCLGRQQYITVQSTRVCCRTSGIAGLSPQATSPSQRHVG